MEWRETNKFYVSFKLSWKFVFFFVSATFDSVVSFFVQFLSSFLIFLLCHNQIISTYTLWAWQAGLFNALMFTNTALGTDHFVPEISYWLFPPCLHAGTSLPRPFSMKSMISSARSAASCNMKVVFVRADWLFSWCDRDRSSLIGTRSCRCGILLLI